MSVHLLTTRPIHWPIHAWGAVVSFVEKRAEIATLSKCRRKVVNPLAGRNPAGTLNFPPVNGN